MCSLNPIIHRNTLPGNGMYTSIHDFFFIMQIVNILKFQMHARAVYHKNEHISINDLCCFGSTLVYLAKSHTALCAVPAKPKPPKTFRLYIAGFRIYKQATIKLGNHVDWNDATTRECFAIYCFNQTSTGWRMCMKRISITVVDAICTNTQTRMAHSMAGAAFHIHIPELTSSETKQWQTQYSIFLAHNR